MVVHIFVILSLASDTPLRGKQLVVYPYQTLWGCGGGGAQFRPQPQPLYFMVGIIPLAMAKKGKLDHIEERIKAIEGDGDYAFTDMAELCLVPDIVILPKFKVSDFDKYKGTTGPKNHLKV